LNGVKWKGRELPKLPILQPEKVTTLPLDIQLTEDYAYVLKGETTIAGRHAYEIAFSPKASIGDKPAYHGTAYIDAETFGLLRRDSVQENLKGETLSNVQSEFYSAVPGRPDVVLPLRIKGQQVFSTAGRTTSIESDVTMDPVEIDPPTFPERLAAAYASPQQMIRDTPNGLRYLLPDPEHPGGRIVQERVSRKSTFGLVGGFYDGSFDYPIPLLGVQHFNFDLWEKGKQISIFFGGALLTANYTDPALGGGRLDLGADVFAVAFPSTEVNYKDGKEVPGENIKHLPAFFSINVGHPLGPYLKASVGVFENWNNYQRDDETAPVGRDSARRFPVRTRTGRSGRSGVCPETPTIRPTRRTTSSTASRSTRISTSRDSGSFTSESPIAAAPTSIAFRSTSSERSPGIRSAATRTAACEASRP
jgi:hypothetical protein